MFGPKPSGIILILLLCCSFPNPGTANVLEPGDLEAAKKLGLAYPDSAFLVLQGLRKKYADQGNLHALAVCYQQLGSLLHNQGGYSEALTLYLKADKIFRAQGDQLELAENLDLIGRTYSSSHLKQKALLVYKEALQLFKRLKDRRGMAVTYSLLGKLFERKNTYGLSLRYQQLALLNFKGTHEIDGIAKVYNDIGSIYERGKAYDTALVYFRLALKTYQHSGNRIGQIGVINNIGDFYRKTGDLHTALKKTLQAKDMSVLLHSKRQLISACDNLAETHRLLGNIDSALFYSQTGSRLYHETFRDESAKQVNLLETIFEVERKDGEIQQLKTDQHIVLWSTGAVILICLLLLLLAFSVLSRQRLKNRDEKIILEGQANFMKMELKNKLLEQNRLSEQLELKSKELTTHTLHIIQKNQLLQELKGQLLAVVKSDKRDQRREIKQILELIDSNHSQEKNWNHFRAAFEQVHANFFTAIQKHADQLSPADLRLLALLKMNLSSSDIATMIGISTDSLRTSKYRLRQKLFIPEGESLNGFIQRF